MIRKKELELRITSLENQCAFLLAGITRLSTKLEELTKKPEPKKKPAAKKKATPKKPVEKGDLPELVGVSRTTVYRSNEKQIDEVIEKAIDKGFVCILKRKTPNGWSAYLEKIRKKNI